MWEVVKALEMYDVHVVSLTCDGAKPNRQFFKMCQKSGHSQEVPYKTSHPYGTTEFYYFWDVPHILKTARNCFSNSFAHSKSWNMVVSWSVMSTQRFAIISILNFRDKGRKSAENPLPAGKFQRYAWCTHLPQIVKRPCMAHFIHKKVCILILLHHYTLSLILHTCKLI